MSSEAITVHEPAAESVVSALTRAELDQQIATAKAYPRSIAAFQRTCEEMVALNADVAAECVYSLPRDGKSIEGPSSRLAEIVASAWGNCRAMARVVGEDAEFVTAQGVFHDLERNVAINFEVRRRITDRRGRRYGSDMIATTGNAACSIALRNAVFKGVPKAYWSPAFEKARAIVAGDPATLEKRRAMALEHLAKQGVAEARVLETLGVVGVQDIGLAELATLRGILTAIKEGDTTLESAFGLDAPKPPAPGGRGVEGLKQTLAGSGHDHDPNAGGVAMDRRANGSTEATTDAAGTEGKGAGGKEAPAGKEAPVAVVTPLSDVERARLRKAVAKALGARGYDAAQAARYLTDVAGRAVDSAFDFNDEELQRAHDALHQ